MTNPVGKKYTQSPPTYADMRAIEWIEETGGGDASFFKEVPLVPSKVEQAFTTPMQVENAIDLLFDIAPPLPWAHFSPIGGMGGMIKRLFKGKILSSLDVEGTLEIIDQFFENDWVSENEEKQKEGEKLLALLHHLTHLDQILHEITLRILSCLKP